MPKRAGFLCALADNNIYEVYEGETAKDALARLRKLGYGYNWIDCSPNTILSDTWHFKYGAAYIIKSCNYESHHDVTKGMCSLEWAIEYGYKLCKETLLHGCKHGELEVVQYLVDHHCPIK